MENRNVIETVVHTALTKKELIDLINKSIVMDIPYIVLETSNIYYIWYIFYIRMNRTFLQEFWRWNMNILNIILLIMGIFNLIVGITWTKKNVINFVFKLLFLVGGGYLVFYALYLSNILIVLNK